MGEMNEQQQQVFDIFDREILGSDEESTEWLCSLRDQVLAAIGYQPDPGKRG